MYASTRALKYVKAGNLPGRWSLLSKEKKETVRHLVQDRGWRVDLAIQHTYIFGRQQFVYDYRLGKSVQEF